jgi:hypothetical protein
MNTIFQRITTDIWITVLLTIFGVIFPLIWSSFQRRRIGQAEIFHREAHNLDLFKALSNDNPRLQIAAAAVLVERLGQKPKKDFERSERNVIIRALISVTKGDSASVEVCKFIADNVPRELGVLDRPRSRLGRRSPMSDYDWQHARCKGAYWRGIDARGVDFFGARLISVGMRNAHLSRTILKNAVLQESVLIGADLQGADLRGADLCGANLEGAVLSDARFDEAKYDEKTKFPEGFDPRSALMVWSAADYPRG